MGPIAYTYEASEHCLGCALEAFGGNENGEIVGTDNEGNEVGAVFYPFEGRDMVCGTCGDVIHYLHGQCAYEEGMRTYTRCTNAVEQEGNSYCEHHSQYETHDDDDDDNHETLEEAFLPHEVSDFWDGYVECAFWASSDNDGESLDCYALCDLGEGQEAKMRAECADFMLGAQKELREAFQQDTVQYDATRAGHDFFLNRCGHGTGFWDRGLPGTLGDRLSDLAHTYRSEGLFLTEDGTIYAY